MHLSYVLNVIGETEVRNIELNTDLLPVWK
jgi:hypothetical protein